MPLATLFILLGLTRLAIRLYQSGEGLTLEALQNFSLIKLMSFTNPIYSLLVYLGIGIACLLLIIKINNQYRFVENASFLIAIYCIIGLSLFPIQAISIPISLALLSSLVCLQLLLRVHHQTSVMGELFLASVLASIATLFYIPFIVLILIVFITINLFRPFEFRNYALVIVGFALPLLYWFGINYLFDVSLPSLEVNWSTALAFKQELNWRMLPFFLFLAFSLLSVIQVFLSRSKFIVRQRNQLLIITSYLILMGLLLFLVPLEIIVIGIVIPMAIFFVDHYKSIKKKWLVDAFLVLLIIASFLLKE